MTSTLPPVPGQWYVVCSASYSRGGFSSEDAAFDHARKCAHSTATDGDGIGCSHRVEFRPAPIPAPSSPDKGTAARDVADAVDSCPGCEAPLWPDNLTVCWNCGQTVIDYGPEFRTAPAPDKGTGRPDTTQMRADADWLRNQQFGTVAYTKADRIDDTADWIDAHTPQPDGLAECLASAVNRATHGRVHLDGEEAELACQLLVADTATPRRWCCNAPAGVRRCLPDTLPPAALTGYHNDCHWGTNQ